MSEAGDTKAVFDPMGNYIQWQHAPTYPPPGAIPPIAASFGGLGPSFGYAINSACVLDGIPTDCTLALNNLAHGSAEQCPNNNCSPQPIPYIDPDTGKPGNAGWLLFNGSGFWASDGGESDYLEPDDIQSGSALDAYALHLKRPANSHKKKREFVKFLNPKTIYLGVVPLDVEDLGIHIGELQSQKDCGDYISALISAAATEANPAHSTNISTLFKMVKNGKGGFFLDNRAAAFGGGGTTGGSISTGDGAIYIGYGDFGDTHYTLYRNSIRGANYNYALVAIHEMIHISSKYGFSDEQLGLAAEKITHIQAHLPALDNTNPLAWSRYWNDILRDRCPPIRK